MDGNGRTHHAQEVNTTSAARSSFPWCPPSSSMGVPCFFSDLHPPLGSDQITLLSLSLCAYRGGGLYDTPVFFFLFRGRGGLQFYSSLCHVTGSIALLVGRVVREFRGGGRVRQHDQAMVALFLREHRVYPFRHGNT